MLSPVRTDATTDFYSLTQQQALVEILPGKLTAIFGYNGITPGPTIMAQRDRPIVVQQINALPQVHPTLGYTPYTSTHLHGSPSLPEYDGYASDVTQPGQWKNYHYPNNHAACTLLVSRPRASASRRRTPTTGWPRSTNSTTRSSRASGCRSGVYDVPLIVKDAMFATDGSLIFDDQRPLGTVRRRHPRQRQAVAGDARRTAQVPLPHAQCVDSRARTACACPPASRSR